MSFFELRIWQSAHQLAIQVWLLTGTFPRAEQFGITSQVRRAAASIGANIAEGFGRYHFPDRIKFLYQARGSLYEVQNFLLLSRDLHYIQENHISELFEHYTGLARGINLYIHRLQAWKTADTT
jgi:four helix bundle protein